jgi:phage baseplate assembly protein W
VTLPVGPTKRLTGYRFVTIQQGDTLQAIAQRELGDAALWADLITINGLAPPYLTGDPSLASASVKLYGQQITLPAVSVQVSATTDPERVFGVDLRLTDGQLIAENGDLAVVAGVANLSQALKNRIETELGELLFHPNYGCAVSRVKGEGGDPTAATLGAKYVEGAILDDPRIDSVESVKATIIGDSCQIVAIATPITGTSIDILSTV